MRVRDSSALFGISHLPFDGVHNNYCGPAALSALTGLSCEYMSWNILVGRDGNRGVASVCMSELADVLHGLDCETEEVAEAQGLTLERFDREVVHQLDDPVLIYLSEHFIVCDPFERTYYDNQVDRPSWISEFPSTRRRIKHALTVKRNFDISELQKMEVDWIKDVNLLGD